MLAQAVKIVRHLRKHAGQKYLEWLRGLWMILLRVLSPPSPIYIQVYCGEPHATGKESGDVRPNISGVGIQRIAEFANDLSNMGQLDRPVNDRTGLTRSYDPNLELLPQILINTPAQSPDGEPDDMGQPFAEALQRQLSLWLCTP